MADHPIVFVGDDVLPEGQDFLLIQLEDGRAGLAYRSSAIQEPEALRLALEDSWAAYRAVASVPPDGGDEMLDLGRIGTNRLSLVS